MVWLLFLADLGDVVVLVGVPVSFAHTKAPHTSTTPAHTSNFLAIEAAKFNDYPQSKREISILAAVLTRNKRPNY